MSTNNDPSTVKNLRNEVGFTLVEVLVVIVIIGVLAAIAVPLLMNQRQKAADASIQSDLRATALAVIALRESDKEVTVENLNDIGIRLTPDVSIAIHAQSGGHHCLQGTKTGGAAASRDWFYTTDSGLDESLSSCSGTNLFTLTN